jgi:hypothetical protein
MAIHFYSPYWLKHLKQNMSYNFFSELLVLTKEISNNSGDAVP